MIKKRKIKEASIPTASMADIAFLLLLFFLVATVIDVDTGIGLALPEPIEETDIVLLDGAPISIFQIKNQLKPRIISKIELPANKKLIVSLKTDRKTNYNLYIQTLDQVKLSYFETRDEYSNSNFGRKYNDLDEESQKKVQDKIPIIIS